MEIIAKLIETHPLVAQVFIVIGILRSINKPLFSLLQAYVDSTASKSDNEFLNKVMSSKVYFMLNYVLEWSTSVKLPTKQQEPQK